MIENNGILAINLQIKRSSVHACRLTVESWTKTADVTTYVCINTIIVQHYVVFCYALNEDKTVMTYMFADFLPRYATVSFLHYKTHEQNLYIW